MATTTTTPTSRRPDAAPEKPHQRHRNPAGCLSGILRLFTRHRFSHHRKRLPSGDRNRRFSGEVASGEEQKRRDGSGKYLLIPEKSAPPAPPDSWLRSCDSLRSPTIQQEIRRSGAAAAVESPRRPLSTVVAKLMGIDDAATATATEASPRIEHCSSSSPESASEKRRRIIGALKQCDEDLKVLRRIIDAVQEAEEAKRTAARSSAARRLEIEDGGDSAAAPPPEQQALPSPVSVLDAVIFPEFGGNREKQLHRKKPPPIAVRSTIEHRPPAAAGISNGGESRRRPASSSTRNFASAADGVAGIWEGGGEFAKEELGGELNGGVGICVEEGIFRELIGEVVLELMTATKSCRRYHYIGAGTCRKRLRF